MISPQAHIHESAKIADNVSIGPFSVIGPNVEIDEGTEIGPHVVIQGPTRIGKGNKFFQFSSIGEAPQDLKFEGENSTLVVGDNNTFRECTTIHRGTSFGGGKTVIGNDNLFMAYSHVAHDCIIGNHVIFSNNASVAGHVTVGDYASLGGLVGVHQFCAIGAYSFAAGGSIIYKDVPPFVMVAGSPASANGLNAVGLERRGFDKTTRAAIKQAYKVIYRQSLTVKDALIELKQMMTENPKVELLYEFLNESTRGIVR